MKPDITNNVTSFTRKVYSEADRTMFKAVMKGGGLVKNEAANRAPSVKIGKALKVAGKSPADGPESRVGIARNAKAWYVKFFESGTKQHIIKPKNGKFLSWITTAGGKAEFTGRTGRKVSLKYYVAKSGKNTLDVNEQGRTYITVVNHPGMKAQPFLIPAFQAKKPEIQQVIAEANSKLLADAAREIGK